MYVLLYVHQKLPLSSIANYINCLQVYMAKFSGALKPWCSSTKQIFLSKSHLQCLQLNIKLNTMCSTRSGSWSSNHHNIPSLCCKKKSTPHSTQTPLAAVSSPQSKFENKNKHKHWHELKYCKAESPSDLVDMLLPDAAEQPKDDLIVLSGIKSLQIDQPSALRRQWRAKGLFLLG